MRKIAFVLVLFLAACAAPTEVPLPEGRPQEFFYCPADYSGHEWPAGEGEFRVLPNGANNQVELIYEGEVIATLGPDELVGSLLPEVRAVETCIWGISNEGRIYITDFEHPGFIQVSLEVRDATHYGGYAEWVSSIPAQ